ncbi:hypothetical protein RI367_004366 [Sorochytrium milnesiophthora]
MGNGQKRRKHLQHLRLQLSHGPAESRCHRPIVPSALRNEVNFSPPSSAESCPSASKASPSYSPASPACKIATPPTPTETSCRPPLKKTKPSNRIGKDRKSGKVRSPKKLKMGHKHMPLEVAAQQQQQPMSMIDKARQLLQTFTGSMHPPLYDLSAMVPLISFDNASAEKSTIGVAPIGGPFDAKSPSSPAVSQSSGSDAQSDMAAAALSPRVSASS